MKLNPITPRFQVEKHTNHGKFAYRVLDMWTLDFHGYGLLADDAIALAIELDNEALEK